jgi:HEAT repeat protein
MKKYVNGIEVPYDLDEKELEKLLADVSRKWAAFEALGNKNTLNSFNILKKYALSRDIYERIAAINALSKHDKGACAADIIYENLKSTKPLVIIAACYAVGAFGLKQFHTEVQELLKSTDPNIRASAIESISGIWLSSDFEALVSIYQNDDDCRKTAAYVLFEQVEDSNWKKLFEIFANDKQVPRHRIWACHIASKYGGNDIIEKIKALSHDNDGHVRKHAKRALKVIT